MGIAEPCSLRSALGVGRSFRVFQLRECRPLIPLKEPFKNSHQQPKGETLLLGSRLGAMWFDGLGNRRTCGLAEGGADQGNFFSLWLLVRPHEWPSALLLGKMLITRLPDHLRS